MKTFKYTINGKIYEVTVDKKDETLAEVGVNGAYYKVELEKKEEEPAAPKIQRPVASASAPSAPKAAGSGKGAIKSPLPGIIVDVKVSVGDTVNKGDTVAVLEAMKMENVISAPMAGKVTSINVNPGDSILEGVVILTIE
ncbi:biotin/lipoyl-containing protein [Dysgonomonas sp. 520]|uniref:biotin/lipoyl-containing protein n=1 Tax=Dysgonomonas sp. 520 TaxID=2302931 RepID=UPI0013D3EF79|nr:biotin/lipoyl-containing protein [Dysgonomonas sp. 520]NDW08151.1 biotin/lipoyl-binding protein [Dysgonomonas sp. 520]